ncbi:MAG TPA: CBS domain-containing protein, partial [Acidimicrobiales bacterium]
MVFMTGRVGDPADVLASLRASDVMVTDPVTLSEHESLASAWEVLARAGCRALPVMRSGRAVGIVDDHAIVCARTTKSLDGRPRLVGDVAVAARTVHVSAPLTELLEVVHQHCTAAVVVDDGGRMVGLVTPETLLTALRDALRDALAGPAARRVGGGGGGGRLAAMADPRPA